MAEYKKPACSGVLIPGKQGRLFGTLYTPEGTGPFPVIILCHGFPGNERLLDFAVFLREQGFCTLHFHYSGSWGSDGEFSFLHCFEDADSVVDYVKTNPDGIFDLSKIFMIGHSLGGLVTCRCAALNDSISAAALIMPGNIGGYFKTAAEDSEADTFIHGIFDDCGQWLKGYSWEGVRSDWLAAPEKYTLSHYAEKLADKPVLFVAGSVDPSPEGESDVYPLLRATESYGKNLCKLAEFDTDHSMNWNRGLVKDCLSEFFGSLI